LLDKLEANDDNDYRLEGLALAQGRRVYISRDRDGLRKPRKEEHSGIFINPVLAKFPSTSIDLVARAIHSR
jgi:hypothetical protein